MATLLDQAVCAGVGGSDRVLVVGVGDDGHRDDGVGAAVVRRLCDRSVGVSRILAVADPVDELRDRFGRADLAVLVLAARHHSRRPGTVHMLATDLPRDAADDGTALVSRLLALPHRVVVYTVEGASFASGTGLSAEVADAVHRVAGHIERQITALGLDQPSPPDQRFSDARQKVVWLAG